MSEPFIGEIRIFAGTFAPQGWALCDGQLLAVSQYDALFSLLGTSYGGDGRTTFGLPDLRGRVPIHLGQGPGLTNRPLGSSGGHEQVTLTPDQSAPHTHPLQASTGAASGNDPSGAVLAEASADIYVDENPDENMAAAAISTMGGSGAHDNLMPFLCVNHIIALNGVYPSRT